MSSCRMNSRMTSSSHRFAKDARESATLATVAMVEPNEDVAREATAILQYRGTPLEFEIARELASDRDPARRRLAADIMGQLGWDERTSLEESVDTLLNLLDDPDSGVVAQAATALGFRNHPRAIPRLLQHLADPEADVRLGVVHGLSQHDSLDAVDGLIRLTVDGDRDVRDWATFGLASLTDVDTLELREALLARMSEDDDEIRGEALIGLARRHHPDAPGLVRQELNRPFAGDWPIEAAELLADAALYPALQAVWESLSPEDKTHFERGFVAALDACRLKDQRPYNE
jgi:HEAT repeat protein